MYKLLNLVSEPCNLTFALVLVACIMVSFLEIRTNKSGNFWLGCQGGWMVCAGKA